MGKEKYEFSPEFEKVIETIETWKTLQESRGYMVSFVAAFSAYKGGKKESLMDCGIRTYGDLTGCRVGVDFLNKEITKREKSEKED